MRRGAVVFLVCAALAGCKRATEAVQRYGEAQQEAKREATEAEKTAPPPIVPYEGAANAMIVRVRAAAKHTKHGGKPWDPTGTEPDLKIYVRVDGFDVGHCDAPDDQYEGACDLALPVALGPQSQIGLRVVDRDSVFDDPVGTAWRVGPWDPTSAAALPMTVREEVESASVELGTLEESSWLRGEWTGRGYRNAHYGHLIALVLGALLGGALVFWVVRREPDAQPPVVTSDGEMVTVKPVAEEARFPFLHLGGGAAFGLACFAYVFSYGALAWGLGAFAGICLAADFVLFVVRRGGRR